MICWQLVSLTHFVPKPEFIVFFGSLFNFAAWESTYDMWHQYTSSTTPGQRSPDRGGGVLPAFVPWLFWRWIPDLYPAQRLEMDTGGDWIIFKQEKSLESISNRIIWKSESYNGVSQRHLKKCSCTTTTKLTENLAFLMYQTVLLQLLQLFGCRDRPWPQTGSCQKIRLAMGYQKASRPSQRFGPTNLAGATGPLKTLKNLWP